MAGECNSLPCLDGSQEDPTVNAVIHADGCRVVEHIYIAILKTKCYSFDIIMSTVQHRYVKKYEKTRISNAPRAVLKKVG